MCDKEAVCENFKKSRKVRLLCSSSEEADIMNLASTVSFNWAAHERFLKLHLTLLPTRVESHDSSKMLFIFFSLSGLDIMGKLESIVSKQNSRNELIDAIYSLQILPISPKYSGGGFRGSPGIGNLFSPTGSSPVSTFDCGNISMTLMAILCLLILRDDFKRLDRLSILKTLKSCQNEDGCFKLIELESESDARLCYCGAAIAYLLDGWDYISIESMISFILKNISHEKCFGLNPGGEAHGGSTFCSLTSLFLLRESKPEEFDKIDMDFEKFSWEAEHWLQKRLTDVGGFNGRPGKNPDPCYFFWIGASLWELNSPMHCGFQKKLEFLKRHQYIVYGGFSKDEFSECDILHTFYSLCGLSLLGVDGLNQLYPPLMITQDTYFYWKSLKINSIDSSSLS